MRKASLAFILSSFMYLRDQFWGICLILIMIRKYKLMTCHYLLDNEGIPILDHVWQQLDATIHHNHNDVDFAEDEGT